MIPYSSRYLQTSNNEFFEEKRNDNYSSPTEVSNNFHQNNLFANSLINN